MTALRLLLALIVALILTLLALGFALRAEYVASVADHEEALLLAACAAQLPADRDDECYPFTYRQER